MKQPSTRRISRRPLALAAITAVVLLVLAGISAYPAGAVSTASAPVAATPISGDIAVDTTWTAAGSPYVVSGQLPIRVLPGVTLTIEPGVEVRFDPTAGLRVEGQLNAQGTQARQVRMVANNGVLWQGLSIVPEAGGATLQSVTLQNALVGLALLPSQANVPPGQVARVSVLDSLLTLNSTGMSADYTGRAAGRLTLRNNLLFQNGVGLLVNGAPTGAAKIKLGHNSFNQNGIGMRVLGVSGIGLKATKQWWGSADGPLSGPEDCAALPVPRPTSRDLACGGIDFQPWSDVPSGRAIVPAGQGIQIESAIGLGALSEDDVQSTSVLTLTVPSGTFTQTVDLIASPRQFQSAPPGQPTELQFEVTAAANGQEIHRFAGGRQLTIEISYLPADLAGADPRKLKLFYYDEALDRWSTAGISTTPDPANQRIIARLGHLTRYRTTSVDLHEVFLPTVIR